MLAIIVVLYKSGDAIGPFWTSLQTQTDPDFRLIAIDNPAGPEHHDAATHLAQTQDPRITIIRNTENVGFARAVNQGIRLAHAEGAGHFMLLNPDTTFPPTFLHQLRRSWTKAQTEIVAPRVMQADAPEEPWFAGGHLDYGWIFSNRHDPYTPGIATRTIDFASGCCLAFTRRVIEQIGLLDESFFVYWEDTDFSIRLRSANLPITYLEHPYLLHEGGASSGGNRSPTATRLYYTAYAQLLRKHFGWPRAILQSIRIWRVEYARTGIPPNHASQVRRALLRGLSTPLRPIPVIAPMPAELPPPTIQRLAPAGIPD